jgi:hypothetical protein
MGQLAYGEWNSGPVMVAGSFLRRLAGIHGVPKGWGVLIPGRSVHGMVIVRNLWAVGLDRTLEVVGVHLLRPAGLATFRGAAAVLELRHDRDPPRPGWVLDWKDDVVPWPVF